MTSLIKAVKSAVLQKKCIVCESRTAKYCVKDMKKTCYCRECATEQFGDLELLEKL